MRNFPDLFRFVGSAGMSALVGRRIFSCLWELTYRCNARCAICGYWRNPSKPNEEMSLSEIQEGLQKIYAYGCRLVNFTGGEPTLRRDLEDIVKYASGQTMWTSMVTNGSLLTRDRLNELKDAGLDNLLVSLDSTDSRLHDEHRGMKGLHAKVTNCLQWLAEDFLTGHRTGGLMCALSNLNIHQAAKIAKFADELGVYVVFQPYHDKKTGNTQLNAEMENGFIRHLLRLRSEHKNILCSESYLKGFENFYRRNSQPSCCAGNKYFSIDPYGFLHPCVDMPGVGHVLRDEISVVRSPKALAPVSVCQGCWYTFRGESDTTLSCRGCLEKLRLGLGIIMHNKKRNVLNHRNLKRKRVAARLQDEPSAKACI